MITKVLDTVFRDLCFINYEENSSPILFLIINLFDVLFSVIFHNKCLVFILRLEESNSNHAQHNTTHTTFLSYSNKIN